MPKQAAALEGHLVGCNNQQRESTEATMMNWDVWAFEETRRLSQLDNAISAGASFARELAHSPGCVGVGWDNALRARGSFARELAYSPAYVGVGGEGSVLASHWRRWKI